MPTYSVDIEPEQVVRWIMEERHAAPATFRVVARRGAEPREIPTRTEFRFGDEEREDLREVATVATLEVAPVHAADGWRLTVIVEDELGPPVADEGEGDDGEEEIELDAFYDEFIRPGRGSANVVAEVEDAAANRRVTRLIEAIERNRHGAGVDRAKG